MTTKTANEPLLRAVLKPEAALPFATSLFIAAPCTFLSAYLMPKHVTFSEPWLWVFGILGLMAVNLLGAMLLEPATSRIGRLTIPALLGYVGVVILFIVAQTLNRFISHLGYEWLFPFVLMAQALCYCGIFRERHLLLKSLLALNGLALTVLWCLGAADRVALPF